MSKVVITAAVNGNRMDTDGVDIPVSPEEIAADALRCQDAGAAVVHFHARDVKTRRSTAEVAVFGDAIARIRARSDMLIETTTGVGPKIDPATGKPFIDPDQRRHPAAVRRRPAGADRHRSAAGSRLLRGRLAQHAQPGLSEPLRLPELALLHQREREAHAEEGEAQASSSRCSTSASSATSSASSTRARSTAATSAGG